MDNSKINKLIEEYIGYVYQCDGYMLPEDDDFFGDMLAATIAEARTLGP